MFEFISEEGVVGLLWSDSSYASLFAVFCQIGHGGIRSLTNENKIYKVTFGI